MTFGPTKLQLSYCESLQKKFPDLQIDYRWITTYSQGIIFELEVIAYSEDDLPENFPSKWAGVPIKFVDKSVRDRQLRRQQNCCIDCCPEDCDGYCGGCRVNENGSVGEPQNSG